MLICLPREVLIVPDFCCHLDADSSGILVPEWRPVFPVRDCIRIGLFTLAISGQSISGSRLEIGGKRPNRPSLALRVHITPKPASFREGDLQRMHEFKRVDGVGTLSRRMLGRLARLIRTNEDGKSCLFPEESSTAKEYEAIRRRSGRRPGRRWSSRHLSELP